MAQLNDKIGPYLLVNKLGRGAFGVVWLAEKRTSIATTKFALKLPRDEDIDLEAVKQEAALWVHASGHPNVLSIIEADVYDGQVVIVSEYAPDGSLDGWLKKCGGSAPSIESAIEMTSGILSGLQHLHGRQIIHRDLKPENILLQGETPRLADFGIARLLKSSSQSSQVSGTFAYMAPEAFDGKRTAQTDVWSAGVIFYQLLAGCLPYPQAEVSALVGAIMRFDPPRLPSSVPASIQEVATRALNKNPTERYESAAEMRRALREAGSALSYSTQPLLRKESSDRQYLTAPLPDQRDTVLTGVETELMRYPVPPSGRMKWIISGVAVLVVSTIVLALAVAGYVWIRSKANANSQSSNAPSSRSSNLAPRTVAKTPPQTYSLRATLKGHGGWVMAVAYSPDNLLLASGSNDATLKLWDARTGDVKQTLSASHAVQSLAFSPDGGILACGNAQSEFQLWDVKSGTLRKTIKIEANLPPPSPFSETNATRAVAFSPDGETLATGSEDDKVRLWNAQTSALQQTLTGQGGDITSLSFSPDGKSLASGSVNKRVVFWDAQTGELKRTIESDAVVLAVAYSPDGKLLAVGGVGSFYLFDAVTGEKRFTFSTSSFVRSLSYSPDGSLLASASDGESIRIWDIASEKQRQSLTGHAMDVYAVAFAPDGQTIASGSMDQTIKLWR